jgi:pimeloyl-ACP methyl ester carboxylesterase
VTVLPRCGHWTMVEKHEECDDLLRRFYAQRMAGR